MFVVAKGAPMGDEDAGKGFFAGVAKGGMTEIMTEGDGLGKVLIKAQRTGDGTRDLHHLQGVGKTGAEVVAVRGNKDLRLVHQATEGLGVDDAVPVPLELVAYPVRNLRYRPSNTG